MRGALREEGDRHHADRSAMWDRIDRARGPAPHGPLARAAALARRPAVLLPRPVALVLRPAGAAVAVAAIMVAGVAGVRLANRSTGPEPDQQPAAAVTAPPTAAPPTADPATADPATADQTTTDPTTAPTPTTAPGSATPPDSPASPSRPPKAGYLSAEAVRDPHSNPNWSQQNVTLSTTETITALDVTLRIARTPSIANTGRWTSIPEAMMTITVTAREDALVYRFVLKRGSKLKPGDYSFAAQFNHSGKPRKLTADRYEATTTASRRTHLTGHFTG